MTRGDLRVLFVQGAGVRAGAERALLARLHGLPDHGVEPVVAFLADGPFREEVQRAGVETTFLGEAPHLRSPARLPTAVRDLTAAIRRHRIDVVEGCGEKMSFLAGWAARLAGRGCVHNLQDAPRRSPGATATQLAALSGRHDEVVVPSEWMAQAFRRSWRLHPRVVPNALVLDDLPADAADVRPLAEWPPGGMVVGLFGRLVAWKGAEVLLRAAAGMEAPECRLLIVGGTLYGQEPELPSRLEKLAAELGLADRVHFTGHRDDALALMAGCDAICHCSLEREPFGMVVIEGMALGKAVIATRTGGPEEIIDHDRTGILLDPGDETALAGTLAELARNPARRHELGLAGRDLVREKYSSDVGAQPLADLYCRAAARRRRSDRLRS